MKVKDLIALLADVDPEFHVVICDNGSILPTGPTQATLDYNNADNVTGDFYIVTEEW
jgi:hypothetical protein